MTKHSGGHLDDHPAKDFPPWAPKQQTIPFLQSSVSESGSPFRSVCERPWIAAKLYGWPETCALSEIIHVYADGLASALDPELSHGPRPNRVTGPSVRAQ